MLALLLICSSAFASEDSLLNKPDAPVRASLHAELGTLAVLSHRIQFSNDGSTIDYLEDGGQDNLFPVARLSAELHAGPQNTVVFLYQPLVLDSKNLIQRDLTLDGVTFPAGTAMDFRYGFSFWRASYLRDLVEDPDGEFSIGGSLQIRNATIEFEDRANGLLISNRDIGPVPVIFFFKTACLLTSFARHSW